MTNVLGKFSKVTRKRGKLNRKVTMRMLEVESDIFIKSVVLIPLILRDYRDFEIARRCDDEITDVPFLLHALRNVCDGERATR